MYCTKCGTFCPENSNFCQTCGTPIEKAPQNNFVEEPTAITAPVATSQESSFSSAEPESVSQKTAVVTEPAPQNTENDLYAPTADDISPVEESIEESVEELVEITVDESVEETVEVTVEEPEIPVAEEPLQNAVPTNEQPQTFTQAQDYAQNQGYVQAPTYYSAPKNTLTPTKLTLRKLACSPFCIIGTLIMTALVIFNFVTTLGDGGFSLDDHVKNSIDTALSVIGFSVKDIEGEWLDGLLSFFSKFNDAINVFIFATMLPNIILCIGVLVALISALAGSKSTIGLTLVKIINTFSLVLYSIAFAIVDIILVMGFVTVQNFAESSPAYTPAIFGIVAVAIIFNIIATLVILYYAKINSTISTMKHSITTGYASARVSSYVAVMTIIAGVINFIIFAVMFYFGVTNISALLSGILSLAFGIFIFTYKSKMLALISSKEYRIYEPTITYRY